MSSLEGACAVQAPVPLFSAFCWGSRACTAHMGVFLPFPMMCGPAVRETRLWVCLLVGAVSYAHCGLVGCTACFGSSCCSCVGVAAAGQLRQQQHRKSLALDWSRMLVMFLVCARLTPPDRGWSVSLAESPLAGRFPCPGIMIGSMMYQ